MVEEKLGTTEAELGEGKPVEEPKSTPEELLKTLQEELADSKRKLELSEKSYKGLQGTVYQKDQELKKQTDFRLEIGEIKERLSLLGAIIAERANTSEEGLEETIKTRKSDLTQVLREKEKEIAERRKAETLKSQQESDVQERDTIWTQATKELKLTEEDDAFWQIRNALVQGDKEFARHLILKHQKPAVKATENETDLRARVEKEVLTKYGLYTPETGMPSGAVSQRDEIIRRYAEGDKTVTREKYEKAMKG